MKGICNHIKLGEQNYAGKKYWNFAVSNSGPAYRENSDYNHLNCHLLPLMHMCLHIFVYIIYKIYYIFKYGIYELYIMGGVAM